jgi:hypothetical protein
LFLVLKGFHGAVQMKQQTTTQRKSKRSLDPLTTKIVTAGVIVAVDWLNGKIFGDKV